MARVVALAMTLTVVCVQSASASNASATWLESARQPAKVKTAIAANRAKLSKHFDQRLTQSLTAGVVRVLAGVERRDASVEALVDDATEAVHWFGESPRFIATVRPDGLGRLIADPRVVHLTPDYQLTRMLGRSAMDVRSRGSVWDWAAGTGTNLAARLGALNSQIPGLSVDAATGKGVGVAIIDNGIDGTHADFGGFACRTDNVADRCQSRIVDQVTFKHIKNIYIGPGSQQLNQATATADDTAGERTNDFASGHGTHVAGIVAGNGYYVRDRGLPYVYADARVPMGVAPQANLFSVKNGDTIWAGLSVFALEWVLERVTASPGSIKVVNNSWGCAALCDPFDPTALDSTLVRELYRKGVVVIFAAGNSGPGNNTLSPESENPYALSVASYGYDAGRTTYFVSDFSSRGAPGDSARPDPATWTPQSEWPDTGTVNTHRRPDLTAPGEDIWSARTSGVGTAAFIGGYVGTPRVTSEDATPRAGANETHAGSGGIGGTAPYVQMSGTSMAAPHVAGAAAVVFSACRSAQPLDVMRALMAGAQASRVPGQAHEVGYGGLDLRAALEWLDRNTTHCGSLFNKLPTASFADPGELTAGVAATFDASASTDPNGPIAAYRWNFGDGRTGEGVKPQHTYARSGTYTVTLTVVDSYGSTDDVSREVTVLNASPAAAFAAPDQATATDTVQLDATGSTDEGSITAYAWDFGDGSTGEGATVEHAWAKSGSYTITLTVTDDEGASSEVTRVIEVLNAAPTAAFTAPSAVSAEDPANFDGSASSDRDGSIVSYEWDFGDGATGSGAAPSHAYDWAGDYTVFLKVTDDEGAVSSTFQTVTVTDEPAPDQKRVFASGLTRHKCDATVWRFVLSAPDGPARIAVLWADGSRERVARTSTSRKESVYETRSGLSEIATRSWADVPSTSAATLTLERGPCH